MANKSLANLQRRLAAIPREIKREVAPALMKSGDEMAGMMRQLVPKDTGALEASIVVTGPGGTTPAYSQPGGSHVVPENAVAITVGNTNVRYGHLVEYGTTAAAAQPFFWPSVRLGRKKATNRIRRAVGKAVRTAK